MVYEKYQCPKRGTENKMVGRGSFLGVSDSSVDLKSKNQRFIYLLPVLGYITVYLLTALFREAVFFCLYLLAFVLHFPFRTAKKKKL